MHKSNIHLCTSQFIVKDSERSYAPWLELPKYPKFWWRYLWLVFHVDPMKNQHPLPSNENTAYKNTQDGCLVNLFSIGVTGLGTEKFQHHGESWNNPGLGVVISVMIHFPCFVKMKRLENGPLKCHQIYVFELVQGATRPEFDRITSWWKLCWA